MRRAIVLFLILTAAAAAQEMLRKFIPLKYAQPNAVGTMLGIFGREIRSSDGVRGVIISGPPDVVKAMEEMIAKMDIPPATVKNVELTAYLLVGSEQGASGPLPASIQPVVKQIQTLFTYKSFRMLDTMLVRLREGDRQGANTTGAIEAPGVNGTKGASLFGVGLVELVPGQEAALVRITNLRLNVAIQSGFLKNGEPNMVHTSIQTNVDVRAGQKVVVGKANVAGAPDQALILVLTAQVLD